MSRCVGYSSYERPLAERLVVYRRMYNKLEYLRKKACYSAICMCLCNLLDMVLFDEVQPYTNTIELYYPEIAAYKPTDYFVYWFPIEREGLLKRMSVMRRVIRDTENKLKLI